MSVAGHEILAREIARRLQPLVPEQIRLQPDPSGITVYETDSGPWGGVFFQVDRGVEYLVEHALSSLQDHLAHAVNGAWPPVGAPRLYDCWVRRDGDVLRLGFENDIEFEPLDLAKLGL